MLLSAAVTCILTLSAADTEIKIGNIMPYTGAFSEYGATGRAEAAYFQMINEQGGVRWLYAGRRRDARRPVASAVSMSAINSPSFPYG